METITIKSVMTPCPYTIAYDESLEKAQETMKLYGIRHLPVVRDDDLVGVVSERDLRLGTLMSKSVGFGPKVGDICHADLFVVAENEALSTVAADMAEHKYDFALVTDEEMKFVGIFTTTDACKVVHMLLDEQELKG